MTAFTNYASNPPPLLYGWIAPMVMGFINTTNPRFSVVITDIVQLTITDASHSDNGSWTFGTANALGDTFTNIFLYIQCKFHLRILLCQLSFSCSWSCHKSNKLKCHR